MHAQAQRVTSSGGEIAFGSRRGIILIRSDGTHRRRLTGGFDIHPAWSPDGRSIVFARRRGQYFQLFLVSSGHVTQLTTTPFDHLNPSWAPDGSQIVFQRDTLRINNQIGIYVMTASGGREHKIATGGRVNFSPAWSPDGKRLAFQIGLDRVYVINVDGSGKRLLVRGDARTPAWSSDGRRIAFERNVRVDGRPRPAIFVVSEDGTQQQLVRYGFAEPAWSPDGTKLAAFRIVKRDIGAIYTIDLLSERRRVKWIASESFAEHPDWHGSPKIGGSLG
jgi:TolB protein